MLFWDKLLNTWQVNLPMIRARFPHADESALHALRDGHHRFTELMAQAHDLTMSEAREEVEDWLNILRLTFGDNSDTA